MLFHRRQHAQITLYPASVVIADVILNHIDQSFLAVEPLTVVAFPLEDIAAGERPIQEAVGDPGTLPPTVGHVCAEESSD